MISYRVEDLSTTTEVLEDHISSAFGETGIFNYVHDLHKNHTHKKEIESALNNYDNMVSELVSQSSAKDIYTQINLQEIQEDFDVFNISSFYDFCKLFPEEYNFIENERTAELDEIIIGLWLKNHVSK